jgi:DNA polymerase alpha subunit A
MLSTWSMTEMRKTWLKSERQDINHDDTASYLDHSLSMPDQLANWMHIIKWQSLQKCSFSL